MCFLCCFSPLNLRLHRNTPAGFLLGGDHSPQWKSIRVKDAIRLSGTAMGVSIYYHQNGSPVRFSLHCVSPVTLAWSNCRLGKVLGVLLRWQATKEREKWVFSVISFYLSVESFLFRSESYQKAMVRVSMYGLPIYGSRFVSCGPVWGSCLVWTLSPFLWYLCSHTKWCRNYLISADQGHELRKWITTPFLPLQLMNDERDLRNNSSPWRERLSVWTRLRLVRETVYSPWGCRNRGNIPSSS